MTKVVCGVIVLCIVSCRQPRKLDCFSLSHNAKEIWNQYKDSGHSKLLAPLNKIITEDPNCVIAYHMKGDVLFAMDSLEVALFNFKIANKRDSGNVNLLFKIATVYEIREVYDTAVFFYNKAMGRIQENGFVISFNKDFEKSIGFSNGDVEYSTILYRRGICNFYRNEIDSAYLDFTICIKQGYFQADSYYFRGLLYQSVGDNSKACDDFRNAVKLGSQDAIEQLKKIDCD